jgi:hypothetical protein
MAMALKGRHTDGDLWEWFREDFQDWDRKGFDPLGVETRRQLKSGLLRNSVLVGPSVSGEGVALQLNRLLTEITPAVWTNPLIKREMNLAERDGKEWYSRFLPRVQAATNEAFRLAREISNRALHQTPPLSQPPILLPERPIQQSVEQLGQNLPNVGFYEGSQPDPFSLYNEETTARGQGRGRPTPNRNDRSTSTLPGNSFGRGQTIPNDPWQYPPATGAVPGNRQHVPQARTAPPILAPPAQLAQTSDSGRNILNLIKVYNDKSKYHGFADDLDTKIRVFYDLYWKSRIGADEYALVFSAILANEASKYYYNTINGGGLDFDDIVRTIRQHFESDKYRNAFQEE